MLFYSRPSGTSLHPKHNMSSTENTFYVPGTCNIGPEEVRRRYKIGFTGTILMVLFILFVEWAHLPRLVRLGLFFPAFYGVSGFLQAFARFCFIYGWKGIASLGGIRKFMKIAKQDELRQDRNKAIVFAIVVTVSSILLTTIYFLFPT